MSTTAKLVAFCGNVNNSLAFVGAQAWLQKQSNHALLMGAESWLQKQSNYAATNGSRVLVTEAK